MKINKEIKVSERNDIYELKVWRYRNGDPKEENRNNRHEKKNVGSCN